MINKNNFIDLINVIDELLTSDNDRADKLSKIFLNVFEADLLLDDKYINKLISILGNICKDKDKWIEYFCYELDFGRKNGQHKIQDKNKKEIQLRNPTELYDFLMTYYK